MRVVDRETRNEFRDKRLRSLESDNYTEEQNQQNDDDDDYSVDGNDDKNKEMKKAKPKPKTTSSAGNMQKKWFERKVKSLERIIDELQYRNTSGEDTSPNYVTVAANASTLPMRHFCSVCGYLGHYTCTRCGSRFCSRKCNDHHKETRCLKFSL